MAPAVQKVLRSTIVELFLYEWDFVDIKNFVIVLVLLLVYELLIVLDPFPEPLPLTILLCCNVLSINRPLLGC